MALSMFCDPDLYRAFVYTINALPGCVYDLETVEGRSLEASVSCEAGADRRRGESHYRYKVRSCAIVHNALRVLSGRRECDFDDRRAYWGAIFWPDFNGSFLDENHFGCKGNHRYV